MFKSNVAYNAHSNKQKKNLDQIKGLEEEGELTNKTRFTKINTLNKDSIIRKIERTKQDYEQHLKPKTITENKSNELNNLERKI